MVKKLIKWCLIIILLLAAAEVALHFYNPFAPKAQPIVLSASKTYSFTNNDSRLDPNVTHTKNAYGFRGPMPNDSLTGIVMLGGSGVECRFLNDGKDWPALLSGLLNHKKIRYWIDNAGVSGINSEGCLTLLQQSVVPLKPKYLIVMTGIDDIALQPEDINKEHKSFFEQLILPTLFKRVTGRVIQKPIPNNARLLQLPTADTLSLANDTILERLKAEEQNLQVYQQHLEQIINACKAAKIIPILVSQPMLYGDDTDPVTNTYLGNIRVGYHVNGKAYALLLKQYNRVMFETSEAQNCTFINLSARLPKDSRYYYDGINFSNDGAAMVAEILFDETSDIISNK